MGNTAAGNYRSARREAAHRSTQQWVFFVNIKEILPSMQVRRMRVIVMQ